MIYPEKERKHRMKTTILQNHLASAMKTMKGLVAKDPLNPFSKVRFDVAGTNVSLAGGNENIQITCRFQGETESDGMVMLPGAYLERFIGVMNGKVMLEQSAVGKVRMTSGGLKFNMSTSSDEYSFSMVGPDEEKGGSIEISGEIFREMLRKVRFAMSTDDTRRILEGVYMEIGDGKLAMTATDGRRMAHVEKELDEAYVKLSCKIGITIPKITVQTIYALLDDQEIKIVFDERSVRIVASSWTLVLKVLAENYPNWRRVVPQAALKVAVIDREGFLISLKAAALALNANASKHVKITLESGKIVFKASGDITDSETQMHKCKMSAGEKVAFRFNPDLLVDALECLDDDEFSFEYEHEKAAVVLRSSIPWLTVVMPILES